MLNIAKRSEMMKKKIILMISLLVVIFLIGCVRGDNDLFIEMVEPKPTGNPGEQALYEDDNIRILFTIYRGIDIKGFTFSLENKSDQTIQIVWDEVVIVDSNNNPYGVIHEGVRKIDKRKPMKNTVIPPGTQKVDTVIPTDFIRWDNQFNRWRTSGFISDNDLWEGKIEKATLILPLIIGEEKEIYSFKFKIYYVKYF